jgi:hypothetical protein
MSTTNHHRQHQQHQPGCEKTFTYLLQDAYFKTSLQPWPTYQPTIATTTTPVIEGGDKNQFFRILVGDPLAADNNVNNNNKEGRG